MALLIFFSFYFSLKLILAKSINETNFLIQLQNNGDKIFQKQKMKKISSFFTSEDGTNDELKNYIVNFLKSIRNYPKSTRLIFNRLKSKIKNEIELSLFNNNMTFFNNLIDEIFNDKNTFFDDLFDVFEKHPEIINDILTLVTAYEEGKNITQDDLFKYIHKILNVEGMDKVFAHILKSPHNGAFFELVEKLLNGTEYAGLYLALKDIIYSNKDKIIQIVYKILKSGILILKDKSEDKEKIIETLEVIRNFTNSIKNDIMKNLKNILTKINMPFLYDLTTEILNSTFIDDLFNALENHTEAINYTLILITGNIKGKNITTNDFFKYIHNILNTDGMDKVFSHIFNSTHNGALLILVEKFLNGTEYAELYNSLKSNIIYRHKDKVIRLMYNILKSGILISDDGPKDKDKIVYILELIKDFINSIKSDIRKYLEIFLNQNNMTFLNNLTSELFGDNSTFINDLFDVFENHTEIINYTLIFINEIIYKNVKEVDEILKHLQKILNTDGMDKVFGHIINPTHFEAILKFIDFINGRIASK